MQAEHTLLYGEHCFFQVKQLNNLGQHNWDTMYFTHFSRSSSTFTEEETGSGILRTRLKLRWKNGTQRRKVSLFHSSFVPL